MASSKRADDDWVRTLSSISLNRSVVPPGEGWKSAKELKKIYNCGQVRLYHILNQGVEDGKIERFYGTEENQDGKLVRRVWYRTK
ncbi:MAG: hypothetical protein CMC82_01670 [Flavobacteriaceae bacterium]|nr:hypothetical protein [Flavobacteriaceae bacterium]